MGFILKVTKGPGEGAEFPFEENEAKLGRTADNDIVVKDSSASRSHCRVYARADRFFIEDLKSANGTKLNGTLIAQPKEIAEGDTITIGEVVFTFTLGNDTILKSASTDEVEPHVPAEEEEELQNEDPNATMLKPPRKSDPEREKRTTRKPPAAARHDTEGEIGTVGRGAPLQEENPGATMEVAVPPPRALAKVDDSTRDLGLKRPPVRALATAEPEELTAADRLRKRREQQKSAAGRVAMGWSDLPRPARLGFSALGALFVLGTLGFIVVSILPKDTGPKKVEARELQANSPAIKDSFGLGDDVTWQRPDMKLFNFSLASPTPVVGVLHFGARDISKEEVSITLNGAEVTTVPPDTIDAAREIEIVFPPSIVKPRDQNQLVFDSVKNPPGNDSWRVFNIWIEIIPIPDLSTEETLRLAKDSILKGDKLFESRDIGPDNLFKGWKTYREAWLLLESMTDKSQVADVSIYARTRMRDLRPMLDQKCNGLMVEYQKAINSRPPNLKMAMQHLRNVERYFPTREHPCYGFSKALLADMDAW